MPITQPAARTFFLNEQHELAHAEKDGGGGLPKFGDINWRDKGQRIHQSLSSARDQLTSKTRDPLRGRRFFLVANPVEEVPKVSSAKKYPDGHYAEKPNYRRDHSRIFRRLGLDLIGVHENGSATVHALSDRVERLLTTSNSLEEEGRQEQSRWATIDTFSPIPIDFRIDREWLGKLSKSKLVDAVVELQPLLTRVEVQDVFRALAGLLEGEQQEAFTGNGSDFSGRHWIRGRVTRRSLESFAKHFFSIQSLHEPLSTPVALAQRRPRRVIASTATHTYPSSRAPLPCVAVVDTGVPANHVLAPYRRSGGYQDPDSPAAYAGDHGSFVASRIVFGDGHPQGAPAHGTCQFLDVMIAQDEMMINDKAVMRALEAVVATSPDVRVFNLSFGDTKSLQSHSSIEKREKLILLQDLDNFVFARDVIVVVAAGNSPPGVIPTTPYPRHVDDPQWALGSWACGFNTLTCGATVGALVPDGLVKATGWPSPFTRIGPGICDAPIPEFAAPGGNTTDNYQFRPHFGVWGYTASGNWEDRAGTSHAAPILAREAAFALDELQRACEPGTKPFAATAKAFLVLTAKRSSLPPQVMPLAERTLGYGQATAERLTRPDPATGVMVWQGVLEGPNDIARVQIPIPQTWLQQAQSPKLRIVCSWETPVHEAVQDLWACRRVSIRLKTSAQSKALRGTHGSHRSYPLIDRSFDLGSDNLARQKIDVNSDQWLLEVFYEIIADHYPGIVFSPQQRIGIAAALFDDQEDPVSPQAAIQALPIAASMVRLSTLSTPLAVPIIVKSRS